LQVQFAFDSPLNEMNFDDPMTRTKSRKIEAFFRLKKLQEKHMPKYMSQWTSWTTASRKYDTVHASIQIIAS